MDISDIELVIVYGVPDGMNQLYQVPEISIIMYKNEIIYQYCSLHIACLTRGYGLYQLHAVNSNWLLGFLVARGLECST